MNGVIPATLEKMWEMNLRKNSKIPTDESKNSFVGIFLFRDFFYFFDFFACFQIRFKNPIKQERIDIAG